MNYYCEPQSNNIEQNKEIYSLEADWDFIERFNPELRTGYLLYVHATQYECTI